MSTLYVNGAGYCSKKNGKWLIVDEDTELYTSTTAQAVVLKLLSFQWIPSGLFDVLQEALLDANMVLSKKDIGPFMKDYVLSGKDSDKAVVKLLKSVLEGDDN